MKEVDVYLFGQILGTHSFLLKDGFLKPDEYSEIKEQYFLPGGETGTAATALNSLGVTVRIDGTWIGTEVAPMLRDFYAGTGVDLSSLTFSDDTGLFVLQVHVPQSQSQGSHYRFIRQRWMR